MSALIAINNINVPFDVVGDDMPTVSSDYVARVFKKEHAKVIRAIENLPSDDFKAKNFKSGTYLDAQLKPRPCYALTRDGFSLLVMGFTGERAYQWKIEFIKAFNMMEAELRRQGVIRYVDRIADLNAVLIDNAKRHRREINGYKSQLKQHNDKIVVLKHELEKASNPRPSDPIYAQIKAERDYYKERYNKLSKSKDETIILNLAKIQKELEKSYTAIGAVMAYADGDDYFIKKG